MVSAKNSARSPLSPAAVDLGLGGELRQQLADTEEERKKKLLRQAMMMQQGAGGALGPATLSLFSNA